MIVIYILIAIVVLPFLYVRFHPMFGGKISAAEKERLEQSPYYIKGTFRNLTRSRVLMSVKRVPDIIKEKRRNRKSLRPKSDIEVVKFDKKAFISGTQPKFIWFGHSTLLFRINGLTIAVDPMFGEDVTPMLPTTNRRYSKNILSIIDELPPIDIVLFTHDHYDHLDYKSVKKIKSKVNYFYGPIGIARHLKKWGVDDVSITELEWYDSKLIDGLNISFMPTNHYSGRLIRDRNQALWGGWIIRSEEVNIYVSGDGGYTKEFEKIGEQYGPFDWCFSECGQYNDLWRINHMFPKESAQAAIDVRARYAIPIHWGGFTLAMHPWKEPVEHFTEYIKDASVQLCVPQIGAIVEYGKEDEETNDWHMSLD